MIEKRIKNKIADLKKAVVQMLSECHEVSHVKGAPSPIWSEVLSVYAYLLNLSEEDFLNIRFHTGLITGEILFSYWHPYPPIHPEKFAKETGYQLLTSKIPKRYWIGEPPTPGIPKPLGVSYKGRIINHNIVRYQKCISNLYLTGIIPSLLQRKKKSCVVEIGGGYGGLAHSLGGILNKKITYIMVDLPEMILFAGSYLIINNPDKKIYVYRKETFKPGFLDKGIWNYDYVLLPHYLLEDLYGLHTIDLAINLLSFPEMTVKQILGYLSLLSHKLSGVLYSDNMDRHPYNKESVNFTKMLQSFFRLFPGGEFYKTLNKELRDPRKDRLYKTYLAYPAKSRFRRKKEQLIFFVSSIDRQKKGKFVFKEVLLQDDIIKTSIPKGNFHEQG